MSDYIYVVTHLEMGWDCVCGAYLTEEAAVRSCFHENENGLTFSDMAEQINNGDTSYVVHSTRLEK